MFDQSFTLKNTFFSGNNPLFLSSFFIDKNSQNRISFQYLTENFFEDNFDFNYKPYDNLNSHTNTQIFNNFEEKQRQVQEESLEEEEPEKTQEKEKEFNEHNQLKKEQFLEGKEEEKEVKIEISNEKKPENKINNEKDKKEQKQNEKKLPFGKANIFNTNICQKEANPLDFIKSVEKEEKNQFLSKKQKRGRKTKIDNLNKINKKIHDRTSKDNLMRKIQIHFISFYEKLLNELLKEDQNLKDECFIPIEYSFKKIVNKNNQNSLNNYSLSELFSKTNISSKFTKYPLDHNKLVFEKIKEKNQDLYNFMNNTNYLDLFEDVYYKSERIVDLHQFGLNKITCLNKKVSLFKDLLENIHLEDEESEYNYKRKLKECVQKYFLKNKPKFTCKPCRKHH